MYSLRMRSVAQRHERQQSPSILDGWINALLDSKPALNLGAPRMMEADDRHQRCKAGQEGRSGYRRGNWRQDGLEFEPIGRDLDSISAHDAVWYR